MSSSQPPQDFASQPSGAIPDVKKGELLSGEIYWKDHYEWLLQQGYRLRSRYDPDWTASWLGTDRDPWLCEDSEISIKSVINHATSLKNNEIVVLKKTDVTKQYDEVPINNILSEEPNRSNPDNHSIPLIDILEPPDEYNARILVLPLLRPFDSPKFETKGEAIQFLDEFVTGVAFLHSHRISHGDISINNIMMDAGDMYPEGFHPLKPNRKPDFSGWLEPQGTRTEKPPRYYLLDYGLARKFEDDEPHDIYGPGSDISVPEFQEGNAYPIDAFHVDVYCVGNMIRTEFLDGDPLRPGHNGYYGFEFIRPLVTSMIEEDPSKRPTMSEVVTTFRELIRRLGSLNLRSPCTPIPDSGPRVFHAIRAAASIRHWWIQIGYMYHKLPPIPKPTAKPGSTTQTEEPSTGVASGAERQGAQTNDQPISSTARVPDPPQEGGARNSAEGVPPIARPSGSQ